MTEQVTLTIDGREVTVPAGTLIVDAATEARIEIPVFCSHPKLDPVACCRMCLVEIEGPRGSRLMTACSVPVNEGMVVHTDTEQVKAVQEANLAFILLNHPLDCPICDKGGECPLQDQTMRFGSGISQLVEPKRRKKKHYLISDTIVLDQERCVVCWRCIRYLEEWEDKPQLGLFERGGETIIDIQDGQPVDAKTSGNIIDICPVGALTNRVARFAYRPWEIERTPSICNHCSVGCNLRMDTRTHELRRVIGRENMLVNDQWICDKGRFAHAWVNHEDRLQMPHIRKEGVLTPVRWSEALQFVAERLDEIKQKDGPDAIGGIGSAKLSNESNYLFQRFFRQIVGTNNIDHRDGANVAAYPTGLPALADIMKPQYGPDPTVDTIVLFGIDPSEELPILDVHIKRAVRRGGAKLIIAHPRQIELSRYDGVYLGYRPGSEAVLLNALTKAALAASGDKKPRVEQLLGEVSVSDVRDFCRVEPDEIERAGELLAQSKQALILYGPMAARGEAGEGVLNGLTNLAMVTGNFERLGYAGLESNSQGTRDMGVLPNLLPGYATLGDEAARERLQELWNTQLPSASGKDYSTMLDEAGSAIKALYIMGADPATERASWHENLSKLDLLVVQDLFMTETAQQADVVLPAVSWAECDGTFTNLERRVQRSPKALRDPDSKAAPDWMILDHLATRMGVNWPYSDEQGITAEITQAVPIYAGLTWDALGDHGLQWDAASMRPRPSYRKVTQDEVATAKAEQLVLYTSAVLYDGGNLFSLTEQMADMAFPPAARLHPTDAQTRDIHSGDTIQIRTEAGEMSLPAELDERVRPGTLWIPEGLRGVSVGDLLNGKSSAHVTVQALAEAVPA